MTKLKEKLDEKEIKIIELAKLLNLSAYRCGVKIRDNRFKVLEINKILKLLNCKYEDLFYE